MDVHDAAKRRIKVVIPPTSCTIINMGLVPSSKALNIAEALSAFDASIDARTPASARSHFLDWEKSSRSARGSSSSSGVMPMALAMVAPTPLVKICGGMDA